MAKYDNNFLDGEDLIECLKRGCEVEFLYNGKKYSITHCKDVVIIGEFYNENSAKLYSDLSQVLEYEIDGRKIRDIISEIKIIDRTF